MAKENDISDDQTKNTLLALTIMFTTAPTESFSMESQESFCGILLRSISELSPAVINYYSLIRLNLCLFNVFAVYAAYQLVGMVY